jgi:hypothetical protein
MANNTSGGGAATHAGTNYQDRVAAWTAVQILAEQDVQPPWDLPATVTLEALQAEAPRPIDDLTVTTSAGGTALAQAKHTVTLETTPISPLGSTIAQFVKEFCAASQPFDPAKDRFVLTTSPLSSAPIRTHLPAFLARMRTSFDPDAEWTSGNQDEQPAASVLRNHIDREWQALKGTGPTTLDLTRLVRLVSVHVLDVDPGGPAERDAKNTLRQRILADPTQADTAWNTLITITGTYAAHHQGADRPALQRALRDAGITLQAQRSYREDIERLKQHTTITLHTLLDFSRIHVGQHIVTIARGATTEVQNAATQDHLLILGVPGAGKSGSLYDVAHTLTTQGQDVVLFAVDQLEAASTGALRNELGLTHELTAILAAWPGTTPGYVIIDALDAARTDGAVQTLHAIMEQIIASDNRWHVIASVRKFDLRYNKKLQQLFHGTPPSTHTDNEFTTTRHVNIPTLTDAELGQVGQASPALAALIAAAPAPLQDLLRLPFNLRLLAELLSTGISPTELHPLRTQIELLDRYWQERIIRHDGHGDARELVLQRTTNAMVQHRALRIPRTAARADDGTSSESLDDLLRTHVLAEWTTKTGKAQREFLTFPHHLLFDYAVARLVIPLEHDELIARLVSEPDLLIAIRPSIDLHYQRFWHTDQTAFWDLTFRTIASPLPEVGKLLGPSVAATQATTIDQTQPLLDALREPARQSTGIAALRHVLATLLTQGVRWGPWIEFLNNATTTITPPLVYAVRPYMIFLSEQPEALTTADRQHVGNVARRLLSHALHTVPNDHVLTVGSITAVTNTITTDPTASVTLLCECITEDYLTAYGHATLFTLARNVPRLITVDPTFVRDLYVAGFRHQDKSDEKTTMGDSQIMPLRSNRRQDYAGGLWQLSSHYATFLATAPTEALAPLLTIIAEFVRTEHKTTATPVPVALDDYHTSLLTDYSSIWDEMSAPHDIPLQMLNTLQQYLEHLTDATTIQAFIQEIAATHPPAVIWRRLLKAGANQPATIGHAIRSLAWDHNILTERDTTRPVGAFITAIFPALSIPERERIESAIMNIPATVPENVAAANRFRDRLLGCIDPNLLTTPAASSHRATLDAGDGPPNNDERSGIHFAQYQPATTTENEALQPLLTPITAFAEQHRNTTLGPEAITTILPAMQELDNAITTPSTTFTPTFEEIALDALARAGVAIGRTQDVTEEQARILLLMILRITTHPEPQPDGEDQRRPVTGWGRAPRITAAEAIIVLARHPSCCTPGARAAILRLSTDPVRAVRLQIATHLTCLYYTAPDLFWSLLAYYAQNEQNPTVLVDTCGALRSLPALHAAKTAELTETILNRTTGSAENKDVQDTCITIFSDLSLWASDANSTAIINRLIRDPIAHAQSLQHLILHVAGSLPTSDPRVTEAAFALVHRTLTNIIDAIRSLEADHPGTAPWPAAVQEQYAELMRCADEVAQRLYFASGAFKNADKDRAVLQPEVFYQHAKPLFVLLATIGHPHTAHRVLETLQYFIAVDPPGILVLIADVVRTGSKYGYQYESLAETVMVETVERYLAEYRPILREHPECHTAIIDILDVFVQVGWPRAHQLAYRLGEIYR